MSRDLINPFAVHSISHAVLTYGTPTRIDRSHHYQAQQPGKKGLAQQLAKTASQQSCSADRLQQAGHYGNVRQYCLSLVFTWNTVAGAPRPACRNAKLRMPK